MAVATCTYGVCVIGKKCDDTGCRLQPPPADFALSVLTLYAIGNGGSAYCGRRRYQKPNVRPCRVRVRVCTSGERSLDQSERSFRYHATEYPQVTPLPPSHRAPPPHRGYVRLPPAAAADDDDTTRPKRRFFFSFFFFFPSTLFPAPSEKTARTHTHKLRSVCISLRREHDGCVHLFIYKTRTRFIFDFIFHSIPVR